MTEDAQTRL